MPFGRYPIWQFVRNTLTLREQPAALVGPAGRSARRWSVYLLNFQRPVLHLIFLRIHLAPRAATL